MYFSVITPAPGQERQAALEALDRPYAEHQWLWRFFESPPETRRDFLFRRDDQAVGPRYHVVSARAPHPPHACWRVQTKPYAPALQAGERLEFQLRANPVITRTVDGKQQRHDVVMDAKRRLLNERGLNKWKDWEGGDKPQMHEVVYRACSDWLAEQGRRKGFDLDREVLTVEAYQRHRERRRGDDREMRFSTVDFQGELVVTDATLFLEALQAGVGHAKAFGCGLLMIRRPL